MDQDGWDQREADAWMTEGDFLLDLNFKVDGQMDGRLGGPIDIQVDSQTLPQSITVTRPSYSQLTRGRKLHRPEVVSLSPFVWNTVENKGASWQRTTQHT